MEVNKEKWEELHEAQFKIHVKVKPKYAKRVTFDTAKIYTYKFSKTPMDGRGTMILLIELEEWYPAYIFNNVIIFSS